jgi:hypothetical protein
MVDFGLSCRVTSDHLRQFRFFTILSSEKKVAVAIEYLNMIIPVAEIEKKYPGGWAKCREDTGCDWPGTTSWSDGELLRLGTMSEMTLQLMGDDWASMGFKGFSGRGDKKKWKDFCQFGSLTGPAFCDWLFFDEKKGTVSLVKNASLSKTQHEASSPLEIKFSALSQYKLDANQAADFDQRFTLVLPDFGLIKDDLNHELLVDVKDVPGVYFLIMRIGQCRYKVYAGKTKTIKRRLYEYTSEFQVHAPNDYKLRFFQDFMLKHDPQIKFDLYFQKSDIDGYTKMETAVVREYKPMINQRSHTVVAERMAMKEAFATYCVQMFERRLTDQRPVYG